MIAITRAVAGRVQVLGLVASIVLGSIPGLMFVAGSWRAWQLTYATFLWSLIAGLVVIFAAFISKRVPYGAWRQGLILSSVVFFSHTTIYLLALLLPSALLYAPPTAGLAPPPPLFSEIAPGLYACSAAMVVCSGPLYFRWTGRDE